MEDIACEEEMRDWRQGIFFWQCRALLLACDRRFRGKLGSVAILSVHIDWLAAMLGLLEVGMMATEERAGVHCASVEARGAK